ncbi:MAG: polysaccharide deacetylase family protein [Candidatus Glassbacteria bacterium]
MGYKLAARRFLESAAGAPARKILRARRRGPVVFFLHGVEEKITDPVIQFLQLKLPEFERLIGHLRSNYEIVPLDALRDWLKGKNRLGAEHCLLSFDDGYRNNLTTVAPLLASFSVPFSVFVSTGNVTSGERFPGYHLNLILNRTEQKFYRSRLLGRSFDLGTVEKRKQAVMDVWRIMLKLNLAGVRLLEQELFELIPAGRLAELDQEFSSEQPLNWVEVEKIVALGATIGSHTRDHAVLHAGEDPAETERQLFESKAELERRLGNCRYLSWPNGSRADVSPAAVRLAKNAGYELAFSTVMGDIGRDSPPLALPRIGGSADLALLESNLSLAPLYSWRCRRWSSQLCRSV